MLTQAVRTGASFTIFSIAAAACAVSSFFVTGGFGLVLAVIAMISGAIGLVVSLLPSKRGGVLSITALIVGLVGVIAAIVRLLHTPGV